MLGLLHKKKAEITGKNSVNMPVDIITQQLNEPRPLPLGRKEFEEWSARIISGAMIPGVTKESQQFALADSLMHLAPTESYKCDAHFVHLLRKFCVNQVAIEMRAELKEAHDKKKAAAEAEAKANGEATVTDIKDAAKVQ